MFQPFTVRGVLDTINKSQSQDCERNLSPKKLIGKKGWGNFYNLDKRRVKLFPYFTRRHLITHTHELNTSLIQTKSNLDRGLWISSLVSYFKKTNAFLVHAILWCRETVHAKWCLRKSVRQSVNGLERGFVEHWLDYISITGSIGVPCWKSLLISWFSKNIFKCTVRLLQLTFSFSLSIFSFAFSCSVAVTFCTISGWASMHFWKRSWKMKMKKNSF